MNRALKIVAFQHLLAYLMEKESINKSFIIDWH